MPAQPLWHQCLSQSTDFSHLSTPLIYDLSHSPRFVSWMHISTIPFAHQSSDKLCDQAYTSKKDWPNRPFLLSSLPSLFHQYNIIFKKHNSIIPNIIYGTLVMSIFVCSIHVFLLNSVCRPWVHVFDVCLSLASTVLPGYSSTPSPSKRKHRKPISESDLF